MPEIEIGRHDSIKVNRNAKGDYSFEVKFYFDRNAELTIDVVDDLKNTYNLLTTHFKKGRK